MRIVISAVLLLGTASAAHTQVNPPQVPLEFTQILATFSPIEHRSTPDILVGLMPEPLKTTLALPSSARVIGSIDYHGSVTAAFVTPDAPVSIEQHITDRLLASGWRRFVFGALNTGGFMSTASPMGPQFCGPDSSSISLSIGGTRERGTVVHVVSSGRREMCRARDQMPRKPTSVIPELAPMMNASVHSTGSGGGSNEWRSTAMVRTMAELDDVLAHYTSQLEQKGWKIVKRSGSDGVMATTFSLTDSERNAWDAVLLGTATSTGNTYRLAIEAWRNVMQ